MELSDVYQKFKTPAFLTCPVCLDIFKEPRLLPCSHTVCLECINGIMTSTGRTASTRNNQQQQRDIKFRCPLCREEVAVSTARNLPVNRALEDIVDDWKIRNKTERCQWLKSLIKTCGEHSKDADMWCRTCNVNICRSCTLPVVSTSDQQCQSHASHEFESLPDLGAFCENEAARLDEWMMIMPTIQEMFDMMKMLGTEETQLHKVQDKFLNDLHNLETEISNLLSMKFSAVITDMNRRIQKLVGHIQLRREHLLKALSELAAKFDALSFGNRPSEKGQSEFYIGIMNLRQLSKQNTQSHESDVTESVSDHRRLIAMCIKKVERFRQTVLDVDFQARSLVTLLRQLTESSRTSDTNTRTTARSVPRSRHTHTVHMHTNPTPGNRGHNPVRQQAPQVQPAFGAPTVFMPVNNMPPMAHAAHSNPVHYCTYPRPFISLPPPPMQQGMPQHVRMNINALPPSAPPPVMLLNTHISSSNGQSPSFGVPTHQGHPAGHPQQVMSPTVLLVPRPDVQMANQSRSTMFWMPVQDGNTATTSSTGASIPSITRTHTAPQTIRNNDQSNAMAAQNDVTQTNNSANAASENLMDITEEESPIPMIISTRNVTVSTMVPDHDESHEVSPVSSGSEGSLD